jgi:SAM-dependent methyltransferase
MIAHMATQDAAQRRAAMPAGTERFLDARSLARDHRRLAEVLRPGMAVLDVGCGSGAITRGIAEAVGPSGRVVGIDVSPELVSVARSSAPDAANLRFEVADIRRHAFRDEFDVVSAARILQWLPDPDAALRGMVAATRPGGLIVVLDYSHTRARWTPAPPADFVRLYDAFLAWRAEVGMDNEMADHLPAMLSALGLEQVSATEAFECTRRGEDDFETRLALWPGVIDTRGHQLVADGVITEAQRAAAATAFAEWALTDAHEQFLYLLAVTARRPL